MKKLLVLVFIINLVLFFGCYIPGLPRSPVDTGTFMVVNDQNVPIEMKVVSYSRKDIKGNFGAYPMFREVKINDATYYVPVIMPIGN